MDIFTIPPEANIAANSKKIKELEERISTLEILLNNISGLYRIREGDNLYRISQLFYGNTQYWRTIYEANKKRIGENPDKITVGNLLIIP